MRRKSTEVLFVPDWRSGNPYMEMLGTALQKKDFHVSFAHYPNGYFKFTHLANAYPRAGVIHIHWLPPEFIGHFFWSRNPFKFTVRLLFLTLDMALCRARGIQIIWTLHNLVEHETPDNNQELRVRALLARGVNAIIAHSAEALATAAVTYGVEMSRKGHVIPHGNYIGLYEYDEKAEQSLREEYDIKDGDVVVLFFGSLRRYKGLDVLLPAFRAAADRRLCLLIAGNPLYNDDDFRRWVIAEAAKDDRVRLSLGFVPKDQVAAYFALADTVVLPFQRTLTSGSVILAMGFGKFLILPESARVLGIPGDAGALYYQDGNGAELRDLLLTLPGKDLAGASAHNREIASRLNWRKIAAATARVYTEVGIRILWRPQGPAPK